MTTPASHFDKLRSALENEKLPTGDKPRLKEAIKRYQKWGKEMDAVTGNSDEALREMVRLLNQYKLFVDLDLIFNSKEDFLYRQKGQLKLDNSIIEEFLPRLLNKFSIEWPSNNFFYGPTNCYSAIWFDSTLSDQHSGAGIKVRTKDQDFAISKKLYIKASHSPDFQDAKQVDTFIAFMATEIKTNLDKTMFQEACATARDLRMAVPGARYFLMCEWLDMTPVSTAPTDIQEVLILRGKRLASNVRGEFSSSKKRREVLDHHGKFLRENPLREEIFRRWLDHIQSLLMDVAPLENDVLGRGYF